jgi:hypothetical protein
MIFIIRLLVRSERLCGIMNLGKEVMNNGNKKSIK